MEMDRTIAVIAVCVTVGFCGFLGMVSFGMGNSNRYYYETANQCIAKGGNWLPMSYGICIAR